MFFQQIYDCSMTVACGNSSIVTLTDVDQAGTIASGDFDVPDFTVNPAFSKIIVIEL